MGDQSIHHQEVGICGLSCRLCPSYHTKGKSRCLGCKSKIRMSAGCPFITCAIKKKGVEFCWDCKESATCKKWKDHKAFGKKFDSFKCYQTLDSDISFIRENGVKAFVSQQKKREKLLKTMLERFNEGRSKSYYCIAATVMKIEELNKAISQAQKESSGLDIKSKSKVLHRLLGDMATQKGYCLKLRKKQSK